MHIGIDARTLTRNPTGMGRYARALLVAMARRYPKITFHCYTDAQVIFLPDYENIIVSEIKINRFRLPGWWTNVQLPLRLRHDSIDVFWGVMGFVPAIWSPCPTLLTIHDFSYHFVGWTMPRGDRWKRALFQRLSINRCSLMVAVSEATAADAFSLTGKRVSGIVHPLADGSFVLAARREVQRVREKYDICGDYLITVATFEPRKNLETLLRAMISVAKQDAHLPTLYLVGGSGWLDGGVRSLAQEAESLGLAFWLGYVPDEDLAVLCSGACVALYPAIYEGFGMPVVEAQAVGVPVIHGAHASMIEAGGGIGISVPPGESDWIAVLLALSKHDLPLTCRLPSDIDQDIDHAAERMWDFLSTTAGIR